MTTVEHEASDGRHVRNAVRSSPAEVRCRRRLFPQRRAHSAQRRVRSPRSGRPGNGRELPRLRAQLEMLKEMGCNAIRTSHNPPAPELLESDRQNGLPGDGRIVRRVGPSKNAARLPPAVPRLARARPAGMLRRDRNHPSVIMWSIGNEVGEQTGGESGAAIAKELTEICHEEDPTRPTISAMNSARAASPFPAPIDTVGLNYQGAGLFMRRHAPVPGVPSNVSRQVHCRQRNGGYAQQPRRLHVSRRQRSWAFRRRPLPAKSRRTGRSVPTT